MSLRVCMIEACEDENAGSIGAFYVRHHAGLAGYPVTVLREPADGFDVELVSVHHCSDFPRLAAMPKRARWRLVGGHPMQNNPRPAIPFADAICVGEGESWIQSALRRLDETRDIESLADMPGTIVSSRWRVGDAVPAAIWEKTLPDNPPHLNWEGTRSAAWYLELARGCPFACAYCELGNSVPFRQYGVERMKRAIDSCDLSRTRKVNFFAPDEASHPAYNELYDYLTGRGYSASFASMRVDSVLRRWPKVKPNHLIRIGVDGLTQETRARVKKPITDRMLIDYFRGFIERGHVNFKMFMIVGYPWDTVGDFERWSKTMSALMRTPLKKSVSLRIKWTPFIPQPCTPLRDAVPTYDADWQRRILAWHETHRRPTRSPGWFVELDGLMSPKSHAVQVALTTGDEFAVQGLPEALPSWHAHLRRA